MYRKYVDTPVGIIEIRSDGKKVTYLKTAEVKKDGITNAILNKAEIELKAYFAGEITEFDIPLAVSGTPFQQAVWREISCVPYGKTVTYSEIAEKIGNEKAVRAVGTACGKNPVWIMLPCHRVIGKSKVYTGYAGGEEMKRFLLTLEKEKENPSFE